MTPEVEILLWVCVFGVGSFAIGFFAAMSRRDRRVDPSRLTFHWPRQDALVIEIRTELTKKAELDYIRQQAEFIRARLADKYPGVQVTAVVIVTNGGTS